MSQLKCNPTGVYRSGPWLVVGNARDHGFVQEQRDPFPCVAAVFRRAANKFHLAIELFHEPRFTKCRDGYSFVPYQPRHVI